MPVQEHADAFDAAAASFASACDKALPKAWQRSGQITGYPSMTMSVGGGNFAGVVLTLALSEVMTHWTTGTTNSGNPLLLMGATVAIAFVAALMCTLPALHAAGADPMTPIRYQ